MHPTRLLTPLVTKKLSTNTVDNFVSKMRTSATFPIWLQYVCQIDQKLYYS